MDTLRNSGTDTIPPYSVVEVTGFQNTPVYALTVRKPAAASVKAWRITGPEQCGSAEYTMAQDMAQPMRARAGTAGAGTACGAGSASWDASASSTGMVADGSWIEEGTAYSWLRPFSGGGLSIQWCGTGVSGSSVAAYHTSPLMDAAYWTPWIALGPGGTDGTYTIPAGTVECVLWSTGHVTQLEVAGLSTSTAYTWYVTPRIELGVGEVDGTRPLIGFDACATFTAQSVTSASGTFQSITDPMTDNFWQYKNVLPMRLYQAALDNSGTSAYEPYAIRTDLKVTKFRVGYVPANLGAGAIVSYNFKVGIARIT